VANIPSYEDFLYHVERVVGERRSGTLFIRTDTNHSVIIGLDRGDIVAVSSGAKHGLEALDTLTQIQSCSIQLDPDIVVDLHKGQLPGTREILHRLSHRIVGPAAGGQDSPAKGAAERPGVGAKRKTAPIDPYVASSLLCDLLQDYLGPVASMICEEVTEGGKTLSTPEQLRIAIDALASEIDAETEAKDFSEKALRQFGEWLQ